MVEEKNCTAHRDGYLKFFDRYDHRDFCLAYAFTYRNELDLDFKFQPSILKVLYLSKNRRGSSNPLVINVIFIFVEQT